MDELSSVLREVLRALGMETTERADAPPPEDPCDLRDGIDPRVRDGLSPV